MKKFFCIYVALAWGLVAFAQTPKEIVTRMTEVWEEHEKEGVAMIVDTKMPIVGTMTVKEYALGDKTRTETKMLGVQLISWSDGVTEWDYTPKDNTVKIKNAPADASSADGDDDEMFGDIEKGYDYVLKEETADAWSVLLKKSKSNKDKDAPKTMEFVIAKDTYYLISFKTKMSGISVNMRDISFGVSEDFVTFNISKYPGVIIEDERGNKK